MCVIIEIRQEEKMYGQYDVSLLSRLCLLGQLHSAAMIYPMKRPYGVVEPTKPLTQGYDVDRARYDHIIHG